MKEYIDKAIIKAELERKKIPFKKDIDDGIYPTYLCALMDFEDFLDTLEVKEMDLENSIVCKVDWYDEFFLDYTQEQQDKLLEKIGANVGDKIRVILIKE